ALWRSRHSARSSRSGDLAMNQAPEIGGVDPPRRLRDPARMAISDVHSERRAYGAVRLARFAALRTAPARKPRAVSERSRREDGSGTALNDSVKESNPPSVSWAANVLAFVSPEMLTVAPLATAANEVAELIALASCCASVLPLSPAVVWTTISEDD